MSIAAITSMATSALAVLLYKQGQRCEANLTTSSETWGDPGTAFPLMYETASIYSQGAFDYQAPAGYAYDVRVLPTQPMNAGDRVVVPADGMTFEVVEAGAVGAPGPLKLLRCKQIVGAS